MLTTMSSEQTNLDFIPRYADVDRVKAEGATFTPPDLARFVAARMLAEAILPEGDITLLDPACGDGALLHELLLQLPLEARKRCEVAGFDTNPDHLVACEARLRHAFPEVPTWRFESFDFLDYLLEHDRGDLFGDSGQEAFDLVIANPTYVRTQVMGAARAGRIAARFGLTGRVDLYYPFLLGMTQVVKPGGVVGIITSNRFMTTRAGQEVRRKLLQEFGLRHVWDLGDTKLFDAAVLPAVLVGGGGDRSVGALLSSIYETRTHTDLHVTDPLAVLELADDAIARVPDGRRFAVRHGLLDNGGQADGVWRAATLATDQWLETVARHTWGTFARIGKIRVGVKSTADKVFVRADWDVMGADQPELLRPLTTRRNARRYRASADPTPRQILYPHESVEGKRRVVELGDYPKARAYLSKHRAALEARTYVIEAGRRWYEVWVPQDPAAWKEPKLVFPDISERPVFWMDLDGTVVNGECYWLRLEGGADLDLLWLALAVANSTFAGTFYDHRFNNRLYAGRRRFITQYVEQFPLPDPGLPGTRAIIEMAKAMYRADDEQARRLEPDVNQAVWAAFGLALEEVSG
jgi:hypothetical protein